MRRNQPICVVLNRPPASYKIVRALAVEPLESRCMLDGDWTLIDFQTELDDLGQVISELENWDFTGDEIADVQFGRRYTYGANAELSAMVQTTDYGIDGTLEEYSSQSRTETNNGFVESYESAVDSDGDGQFDQRISSTSYYESFDGSARLKSTVAESDDGDDGKIDYRSVDSYEYSAEDGWQILSITTEIDSDGDGQIDSTSVITFTPGDGSDGGTVIDGEVGGEPGDSGDGVDENSDGIGEIGDDTGEVEVGGDYETDFELGTEFNSDMDLSAGNDLEPLAAANSFSSARALADSVDWLAYQSSLPLTGDSFAPDVLINSYQSLPLASRSINPTETLTAVVVVPPTVQSPQLPGSQWANDSTGSSSVGLQSVGTISVSSPLDTFVRKRI